MNSGTARSLCLKWALAVLAVGAMAEWPMAGQTNEARRSGLGYVRRQLHAAPCTAPPRIDGDISDEPWSAAQMAEGFPDRLTGSLDVDQTTARVMYDGKFIYVAFHCKDSDPSSVMSRETMRDSLYQTLTPTEDCVEVAFDTFLTHRATDITRFALNAIGTRSARMGGGRARKVEWSGDWDGATRRVNDGWDAEMRIPWGILNYPSGQHAITMGINFRRYQYRTKIESQWSNTGPQQFEDLQGRWMGVRVPRGAFRPALSLLQFTLPSLGVGGATMRTGMDARYTLTPELTVVGTISPDFSTIEDAIEGIQFTRGERFVPEKRPFFLEGGAYFTSSGSLIGQFFYSRRISTLDMGAKVFGKIGTRDSIGLLHAVDLDGSHNLATQLRHDFSATTQGSILVTRRSGAGEDNTAALFYERSRWGKLMVEGQLGVTTGPRAGGSAKGLAVKYMDKVLNYTLGAVDLGDHLRVANGYLPFVGYRGGLLQVDGGTEWRTGPWRSYGLVFLPYYLLHSDGRPLQRGVEASLMLESRSDWRLSLDVVQTKWDDEKDATLGFSVRRNASNRFNQWGLVFQTGTQGDRPATYVGPDVRLRVARRLDLAYTGALQNLDGAVQQHIGALSYEISPTRSVGGRLVVRDGRVNWYLSLRNSGGRGAETFVMLGDPNAARFTGRVTVKHVVPL